MKPTFQDIKQKVTIAEVAEKIGYKLSSSASAKHLEYKLYLGNSKVDEVVIYRNVGFQTYFSRGVGDKGDLVSFVYNRLNMFSNYTGTGYEAVYEILTKECPCLTATAVPVREQTEVNHSFNIEEYDVSCKQNVIYAYLNKTRGISMNTISDFLRIGSITTVSKKNQAGHYSNVAFPFRVLDEPGAIVNFELRNYNSYKKEHFKGFCTGGNKSSACWIASFASEWKKVKNLYVGESALDMMSLYEMLSTEEKKDAAFISVGGNLLVRQIMNLRKLFPNAVIHFAFDNDAMGQIYDVVAAYWLVRNVCVKGFKREDCIVFSVDGAELTFNADNFSSLCYLIENDLYPNWLHIKKAVGTKDFNDMLNINKK